MSSDERTCSKSHFWQIQIFTTKSSIISHTFQNRLRIGILQYQS